VPESFGTLVQRGRALTAFVLLAVGCGGAGYGPVAQCRASQLHGPLDALGAPGLRGMLTFSRQSLPQPLGLLYPRQR
jgi:hypothetical protein